jgi:hypothetical protein
MNKNKKLLIDFSKYCTKNPNLRFWQALRNWADVKFIYASSKSTSILEKDTDIVESLRDTFYWENKNDDKQFYCNERGFGIRNAFEVTTRKEK